jgi:hypothetical protein
MRCTPNNSSELRLGGRLLGFLLGAAGLMVQQAWADAGMTSRHASPSTVPAAASQAVHDLAQWVMRAGDNRSLPFVIVDKVDAQVFVFRADGQFTGAAAALIGSAVGDETAPGIGNRPLSGMLPAERTTPAGRFVASTGRNLSGTEIIWVDYDNAVSLHPVIIGKPAERRLQRLVSPTPADNRITYGCINVPARFFQQVVKPAFSQSDGIVYVLPETHGVGDFFGFR